MASSSPPPPATLQYLAPPPGFAAVQAGVYRCGALPPGSFAFVRRLGLRTALWLSNEHPVRALTTFFQDTDTTFVSLGSGKESWQIHLGLKAWKPYATWKPISEELIKEALELVLDRASHPIMVMCASGIHHTGTLVGCLRRIQKWNLTSVIEEYRRYAGSKARYVNEQFIELFDEDLVTLPPSLPDWFLDQRRMMEEEEREYEAMEAMAAEKKKREEGGERKGVREGVREGERVGERVGEGEGEGVGVGEGEGEGVGVGEGEVGGEVEGEGEGVGVGVGEGEGEVEGEGEGVESGLREVVERRREEREERRGFEGRDVVEVGIGRFLESARKGVEGEEGGEEEGDDHKNKDRIDDISIDRRDVGGNVNENICEKETPTNTRRISGSPLSMQTVSVSVTGEPPGYQKFYYSKSGPLTTEDREYRRRIIGKV